MTKIRITESELVELIEKLVKENLGFGNGQNLGIMNTPTSKYKDLAETQDMEEDATIDLGGDKIDPKTGKVLATEDDITDNEEGISEDNNEEEELDVNLTKQPGSDNEDAWMESISESKLIKRLTRKLHEAEGKGCAESEGGSGCIKKGSYTDGSGKKYSWHILNNKKGGIWRGCSSEKDCESILDAFHANS
jgi:hypothetical protein